MPLEQTMQTESASVSLSADALAAAAAVLDAHPVAARSRMVPSDVARAYRQAAAVLVCVRDPVNLCPITPVERSFSAIEALGIEFEIPKARIFGGGWILTTRARRLALAELDSPDLIAKALHANPAERSGGMQALYERILFDSFVPEGLSAAELEQAQQILIWLQEVKPVARLLEVIRKRLQWARVMSPFEALAGDGIFQGRTAEMDALRQHVGVLRPQQLLNRLKDTLAKPFRKELDQPIGLSVFGPGGVGKSSIIGRFALEHLRLPPAARIPFAYLDFDRSDREIADPLSLVVEMVRQVRIQRPEGRELDALWRFCEETVLPGIKDPVREAGANTLDAKHADPRSSVSRAISLFADFIGILYQSQAPTPFVLVLDSFEEIQYRNEAQASYLWSLLTARQWPGLRVVVVGRAPVLSLRFNNVRPQLLEIGELDTTAALSFLLAKGVTDPQDAEAIVGLVGGVPLSLLLAASLLQKSSQPGARIALDGVPTKRRLWFSVSDEVIQGQLYDRILGHIHSPRVRALAHPGLALRRITPETISKVLDKPCALFVKDERDAVELFEELRRETSLVSVDDLEGALIHRNDLRRMMLRLQMAKDRNKILEIHRAAVAYYQTRNDRRARAEWAYHSLHLDVRPDQKWFIDPDVRASIQVSISDFTPEVQRRLLRLGFSVAGNLPDSVTESDKEAAFIAISEGTLPFGISILQETYEHIEQRVKESKNPTRLYLLAARFAGQMRAGKLRREWLMLARARLEMDADPAASLEYLSEQCWDLRAATPPKNSELRELILALREFSTRLEAPWGIAQANLQRHLDEMPDPDSVHVAECVASLLRLDPRDVWNLFLLIGPCVETLCEMSPPLWDHLSKCIGDSGGAFADSQFDDREAALLLSRIVELSRDNLSIAREPDPKSSRGPTGNEALAYQVCRRLAECWPYAVLRVQPPFGSRTRYLSESAA
jgi:hypothetical protein